MVAPLVLAGGLAGGASRAVVVAEGARQTVKAAQEAQRLSAELIGYDFVGLLMKVVFFQIAALAIAKYIEGVLGASNFIVGLARLLGFNIPAFLPQSLIDFYQNGWAGVKYWDIVKLLTVAIIAMELNSYANAQKKLGGEPSPAAVAVFLLLIGFFMLITLPEMIQRIKDAAAMSSPPLDEVIL